MKKTLSIILLSIITLSKSYSQTNENALSLEAFYSRNGTGDLNGFVTAIGLERQIKNRFYIYNNLAFTIHSAKDNFYQVIRQPTNPLDKTEPFNFVTAGLQTSLTLFYTLLKGQSQNLQVGAGTVIRFQNTSLPEKFAYGYENSQDRQPSYIIYQTHPTSLSIGYQFALKYQYLSTKKMDYTVKGFYQKDTNSDLIVGIGLTFALKFTFMN